MASKIRIRSHFLLCVFGPHDGRTLNLIVFLGFSISPRLIVDRRSRCADRLL